MLQVGVDIGGSHIAIGVVDDELRILARDTVKFPTGSPYRDTVALVAERVERLAAQLQVSMDAFASVGLAVPGSISRDNAKVIHAYNLQFHDVPLRDEMQKHVKAPVYLANDANAAALAELWAGAFRGCKTAALLTLGTGVGGGLILGGRMFNGGMNSGVELGHMALQYGGPLCTCGVRGCVEALCTATWLRQQGRKSVVEYPLNLIYTEAGGDMDRVSAKLVIDCAKAGDVIAMDIFRQYVDQLGSAIAGLINLLDLEAVALGGGVSLAGEFLFDPLRENVREKCFFEWLGRLIPAEMGNDAGIIGAALLHKNENA